MRGVDDVSKPKLNFLKPSPGMCTFQVVETGRAFNAAGSKLTCMSTCTAVPGGRRRCQGRARTAPWRAASWPRTHPCCSGAMCSDNQGLNLKKHCYHFQYQILKPCACQARGQACTAITVSTAMRSRPYTSGLVARDVRLKEELFPVEEPSSV